MPRNQGIRDHGLVTGLVDRSDQSVRHASVGDQDFGYGLYGLRNVSVLRFIRQSRRLGLSSMEQIAELIGMWGDDARSRREVKTVAQRHLGELEEDRREVTEMKNALERVVRACRGDDHANYAILENLAVKGPTAPLHDAKVIKSKRKDSERANSTLKKTSTGPDSHIDLMAWRMRGVTTTHG